MEADLEPRHDDDNSYTSKYGCMREYKVPESTRETWRGRESGERGVGKEREREGGKEGCKSFPSFIQGW